MNYDRDALWKAALKIWALDNEFIRVREMGRLLGLDTLKPCETVRANGLHRPHKREAFFARLAIIAATIPKQERRKFKPAQRVEMVMALSEQLAALRRA